MARVQKMWRVSIGLLVPLLLVPVPAHAEFEIQESTIDAGEIQLQYRGAWRPNPRAPDGEPDFDVLPDVEGSEADLRQSHDFELQMSPTSHWLLALTHVFDEPADGEFRLTAIEFESQVELITRNGDGIGLAIQGGTERPVQEARREEDPDFHFGPIVELSKSNFTLVTNPLFFKQYGDVNDQEGWGFEYGWQGRYEALGGRLWLAVEMFGEIEDMANAGPFDQQEHSIGPAFYYTFGYDDDGPEDEFAKSKELTVSLGGQFGLTEATSDFALKVFIGYEYN